MTPKQAQLEMESAKQRLIRIMWELRDDHYNREANSLDCLIAKLEALQNNPNWR